MADIDRLLREHPKRFEAIGIAAIAIAILIKLAEMDIFGVSTTYGLIQVGFLTDIQHRVELLQSALTDGNVSQYLRDHPLDVQEQLRRDMAQLAYLKFTPPYRWVFWTQFTLNSLAGMLFILGTLTVVLAKWMAGSNDTRSRL
jgi:hypothetical protein